MGRSGYCEDGDYEHANLYRGSVERAIRGRRGQAFLKELLAALDAMPEKKLIEGALVEDSGAVCALGAVAVKRGINTEPLEVEFEEGRHDQIAKAFGIAESMAREIVYMNDEHAWSSETPEKRFERMRQWVASEIRDPSAPAVIGR